MNVGGKKKEKTQNNNNDNVDNNIQENKIEYTDVDGMNVCPAVPIGKTDWVNNKSD